MYLNDLSLNSHHEKWQWAAVVSCSYVLHLPWGMLQALTLTVVCLWSACMHAHPQNEWTSKTGPCVLCQKKTEFLPSCLWSLGMGETWVNTPGLYQSMGVTAAAFRAEGLLACGDVNCPRKPDGGGWGALCQEPPQLQPALYVKANLDN